MKRTFTFEDFLSQYRDNPRYELADGELIDRSTTGPWRSPELADTYLSAIAFKFFDWFLITASLDNACFHPITRSA
ncbi:hypothetical protein [Nostoc sp.]|uniref:hypothetical protein n=1 Tax=Nostoc sp. TaxID=1180 RepID=UPI003FA605EA